MGMTKGARAQRVSHSEVTEESLVETVPRTESLLPSDASCSDL